MRTLTPHYRKAEEQGHVVWIDNFSKFQARQIPNIGKGTFQNMQWTGRTLRVTRTPVSMSLMYDGDEVIPAMPDDIFATEGVLTQLHKALSAKSGMHEHKSSLVTKFKVLCVPVKPEVRHLNEQKHKDAIKAGHDGLDNLLCDNIVPINIGSNRGLLQILRDHYVQNEQHVGAARKYTVFNCDENIYIRIIKVHSFSNATDIFI